MHPQWLPAASYFLSAAVAIVGGYRSTGKTQRAGMASAAIGFILLGADRIVASRETPSRSLLIVAGSFLLAGIFLYWFSHLRS